MYGLIGQHLSHTYSPLIHAELAGLDYHAFELEHEGLQTFLRKQAWLGLNVTIPYKKAVLPYCDYLSDEVKVLGAANTLVKQGEHIAAYNTDVSGFEYLLFQFAAKYFRYSKDGSHHEILRDFCSRHTFAVLGTGGASAAVVYTLQRLGARVVVISRSIPPTYSDLYDLAPSILINTTPCGMSPHAPDSALTYEAFDILLHRGLTGVIDIIYNPHITQLMHWAQLAQIPAIGGIDMLIAQAAEADKLFGVATPTASDIQRCSKQLQKEMLNIALIGMPGVGKTTLGKSLARYLNREFYDTDKLFEERFNISCACYINRFGESSFRERESEILRSVAQLSGVVIATGGGTPTVAKNELLLKQNSHVVWLQRPLSELATKQRPLSAVGIETLWEHRKNIYQKMADITVHICRSINEETIHIASLLDL